MTRNRPQTHAHARLRPSQGPVALPRWGVRAAPQPQTISVPPLSIRADLNSFDPEARTVEIVFSTGAAVERFDWMTGKRYLEKLAITPVAMRLERLNAGAPLLDSHSSWSVTDQIGAVVPGTARVEKGKALATVKFSARESVAPILQDVRDGILRSVSVGYRVHKFEEDASGANTLPVRTAVDWEPFEVSMVSMPADTGAKVRREDVAVNDCCLIVRRALQVEADADRSRRFRLAQARY